MRRKVVNKKLYTGLVISFCVIILFSIILAAVGVQTIKNVKNNYSYTIEMPEGKIRLLKDVKMEFMVMRYRVANYVMNSGDAEYIHNIAYKQYEVAMLSLLSGLEDYIQLCKNDIMLDTKITEENIHNIETFKELITQYNLYAEKVMEISVAGDAKAADDILKEAIPIAEGSLNLLDEMIADSDESIKLVRMNTEDTTGKSIIFLVVLATVLVCFASILSHLIIKAIAKYIDNLRDAEHAAEESSRLKSVFLANMSHEIRTPMNSIIGFSELALDDNISPKTKDYLEKIKSSSEGLLEIINDVLDKSKIEAGKMSLENIPFSLNEVFRVCQVLIAPKASDKGIVLFCYAEPSINKMLLGDPTRLRQVLLNLLSNAVKFTNVGVVKLLSVISEASEEKVTVHFEIKDSGIGMTPEQIGKIFEPFMQADDGTTRKFGGTGLGLSIAKNIIDIMGGELIVESTPGVGSKFSFDLTFFVADTPLEAVTSEKADKKIEKPTFDKGEILICEDNSMNQQVICDHLSRVGLKTTIAVNGKDGVDYVANRLNKGEPPFDLIFMDIHMPVMDGFEAAEKLNLIGNKTPIVALTANIMPNDRETYRSVGMPDCLAKPFTTQELWACLTKYLIPVSLGHVNSNGQSEADRKLSNQLLSNFSKDNQTTFKDIDDAIKSGNIKLAHRLAHTLKGVAGLIGKSTLQEAAHIIECSLANGESNVTDTQMKVLELELSDVLSELKLMTDISKPQIPRTEAFDRKKALELAEKLEPMLKSGNTDCLDMIDELAAIPDSGQLIEQIEGFNFTQAGITLADIILNLEQE